MTRLTKRRTSSTSVGRFILDVIKPTPVLSSLGKRNRRDDSSEDDITRVAEAPPARKPAPHSSHLACVALQNEDPTEDAVVITSLNVIPFCCHADLITMSRTQLLGVAATMNAKLPLAMQIDTSRSDTWIRHSIEVLVGIREAMPEYEAGPLTRSRTRAAASLGNGTPTTPRAGKGRNVPASPMSPLASRARPSMSFGTPSLAVLREDSGEAGGHPEAPPQKKRRTENTLPFDLARPITRAQGRRVSPLLVKAESTPRAIGAAAGARILRSRSAPHPSAAPPRTPTGTPRRSGRSRTGRATKSHTFAMTSTPKKRSAAAVNSPATGGQRTRSLLAEVQNVNMTARGYLRGATATPGNKMMSCEDSAGIEEITFGLDGLTMPMVSTSMQYFDMELCSD